MKAILTTAVLAVGFGSALWSDYAAALDLVTAPSEHVYVNAANPGAGQFDAVVHAIGVTNDGSEPLHLEEVTIDVMAGGHVLVTKHVGPEVFGSHTGRIAQMLGGNGATTFVGGMLANPEGVEGFFGNQTEFAQGLPMSPQSSLLAVRQFLAFDQMPDRVRITARGVTASGEVQTATHELSVMPPDEARTYAMPLEGSWYMRGVPLVTSHHRFVPATEYALDFFRMDAEGRIFDGDRADPTTYFGYGATVYAMAPGRVVRVINDSVEDLAFRIPREGESREAFDERISAHYREDVEAQALAAVTGNLVVIEQDDGYFAAYGHLAESSVLVEVGQRVETGTPLAAVGGTGEGGVVHLHVQLNEGPEPLFSLGVPFQIEGAPRDADTGRFFRAN